MSKKVGSTVNVRNGQTYDHSTKSVDNANTRSVRQETIIKVFSHGVKTKESGYVNNNRIIK